MLSTIIYFGEALRANGLSVSAPELCDAVRALDLTGFATRNDVQRALSAALCKRTRDAVVFDAVFDAHFPGADRLLPPLDGGGVPIDPDTVLALAGLISSGQAGRLSALARYALTGEGLELLLDLLEAGGGPGAGLAAGDSGEGLRAARLLDALAWEASDAEIRSALDRLAETLGPERVVALADAAGRRRARLRETVREYVRRPLSRGGAGRAVVPRKAPLREKSFYLLTESDIADLRPVVAELARRIRARARKKKKRFSRGKLDVQRTMRLNVGSGGVPMRAAFRKRRPRRSTLAVLCDLSDSVRNVSRFALEFAYTLQDVLGPVRSFGFVNEVGEATALFKRHGPAEAVGRMLAGEALNVWGNSNYGRVFDGFLSNFPAALTRDTVLLIIGDGRNNYHYANEEGLRDIRRKVRSLIWLTPEPESSRGFGDSEMRRYKRHCDRVETVRNLGDLKAVVDRLVL